jgi:hypothetical protein
MRIIKLKRMKWAGHVTRIEEKRISYRLLIGKPEGKRPLGRTKRRWAATDNIYLLEIGISVVAWIGLALDRDMWRASVKAVMKCGIL